VEDSLSWHTPLVPPSSSGAEPFLVFYQEQLPNYKGTHNIMNSTLVSNTPISASSRATLGTRATPILQSIDKSLDLNGRKMAVVNLEAALSSWRSIKNHKVNQLSEDFRVAQASKSRISPAKSGTMPFHLMRHLFEG
jgi:hypothetical protein